MFSIKKVLTKPTLHYIIRVSKLSNERIETEKNMATYLYCRISQKKQNIERQKRNLKLAFPDGIIIEEAYTGTTAARPAWARLFKKAINGDLIVFDSVSRMSRNAEEGMDIYEELYNRGVSLVFLKEPHINTEVYREKTRRQLDRISGTGNAATDKLINSVLAALQDFTIDLAREQIRLAFEQSEKEVKDLQQRTKEGLQTAILNGKKPGIEKGRKLETAKAKMAKKKILELSKDFNGSNNDLEVMAIVKVARNTFYKYKSELKAERAAAAIKESASVLESK